MRKIVLLILLLAGCSGVPTIPGIGTYKIDVQQGNYVSQEMASKLKLGMTRSQVRFVLGTPLVVDLFRTDRWDYVYVYQKGGAVTEHRTLTVFFEGDKLARVEGDVKPASQGAKAESGAAGAGKSAPEPGAVPPKPETAVVPAKTEGATLTTTTGEPVGTALPKTEPAKTEPGSDQPKEAKPQEEKGFFGRMLDKIGF